MNDIIARAGNLTILFLCTFAVWSILCAIFGKRSTVSLTSHFLFTMIIRGITE